MKSISIEHSLFSGAVSVEETPQGWKPWRIPYEEKELFPPQKLIDHAEDTAGVRVSFISNTTSVGLRIAAQAELVTDCVVDGELVASGLISPGTNEMIFNDLPAREKHIDLYLPQKGSVEVCSLEVQEQATFHMTDSRRKRWIAYGSSITKCADAESPAQTWPAITARRKNWDLTCLGFGGQCHLDPMMARMIRDLPADAISLCFGINVYGKASLSPRTFMPAVIGFIKILREKHTHIPIVVMSPIFASKREYSENAVGLTIASMREMIEDGVTRLKKAGDSNLYYINGLEIFGQYDASHLFDGLHPDAQGYKLMAERYLKKAAFLIEENEA